MARPKAPELTERELEVMHLFWSGGPMTAPDARERLAEAGRDLAYTTVATLVRILVEKGFLEQQSHERPYIYAASRSFDEVSTSLLGDLVNRVFRGSREALLVRLLDGKRLSAKERRVLRQLLDNQGPSKGGK